MEKSESIKELAIALNKAQATLQVAKKGSENPYFHSKYADLLSVWDACREALVSNGLSVVQIADISLPDKAVLETILMHTSGEWIKGRLPLLPVKPDPQAQGSAITYARRYSLSAIIGLCTEEDDDAETAMDREKPKGTEIKGHWCAIHETPFFKRGKMKTYAHPIKDDFGEETGEWCNEVTEKAPEPKLKAETLAPWEAKILAPSEKAKAAPLVPPAEAPETNQELVDECWEKMGKETVGKVQNVTELKALMAKHKIGTREVLEILAIKSFMEIVDPDESWKQIKTAKKI